jgi:hypothetical protein
VELAAVFLHVVAAGLGNAFCNGSISSFTMDWQHPV